MAVSGSSVGAAAELAVVPRVRRLNAPSNSEVELLLPGAAPLHHVIFDAERSGAGGVWLVVVDAVEV